MRRNGATKPDKPYAAYPLWAHNSGLWAKRIGGRVRTFGVWADPGAALTAYLAFINGTPLTVADSVGSRVDAFVAAKTAQLKTGDIVPVTFDEYENTARIVEKHFGRARPLDSIREQDYAELRLALSKGKQKKKLGAVTLKRRIIIARMIFPNAGKFLKPPSQKLLREAKAARGEQLYEPEQIRALVNGATPQFKWLLLMGINCAFGPRDCELFPGPDGEWHNFPRPKTGIARRCWLWPETVESLKAERGKWDRYRVAKEFTALCTVCEVPNHGFYSLKRTFVTVADGPQAVIDRICGWSRNDMASIYRQKTFDAKLRACSEGIRAWYLGATVEEGT